MHPWGLSLLWNLRTSLGVGGGDAGSEAPGEGDLGPDTPVYPLPAGLAPEDHPLLAGPGMLLGGASVASQVGLNAAATGSHSPCR